MNKPSSGNAGSPAARAALSTVTAVVTASAAQAAIVTNTDLGLSGFTAGPASTAAWDIDHVGAIELALGTLSGGASRIVAGYFDNQFRFATATNGSDRILLNLGLNAQVVGNYFPFSGFGFVPIQNGAMHDAQGFVSGETGYAGFKFNPSGSLLLYGWAEVVLTPENNTFQVVSWAYEDTGAGILTGDVGAIPEPANAVSALGMLALGAAGVQRWRRNRAGALAA